MNTITQCFTTILTGAEPESKTVARSVRKLVFAANRPRNDRSEITRIIETAPEVYESIQEEWRQEYFVVATSILYFLKDEALPIERFFPWHFHLLQHPRGNIRQSVVRMLSHDLGPLTVHIRVPDYTTMHMEFTPEHADAVLFDLFQNLQNLAEDYYKPTYKRYKYVQSLPIGTYKSVQLVLGYMEDLCGKAYIARLHSSAVGAEVLTHRHELIQQIVHGGVLAQTEFALAQTRVKQMRQEFELEMQSMLATVFPKLNIQTLITKVYEGTMNPHTDLQTVLHQNFNPRTHSTEQREALLDFISTIWNLYPHKELEGYSPYEIATMHEIASRHTSK